VTIVGNETNVLLWTIILFLGFVVLASALYYFGKVRIGSDFNHTTSIKLPQNLEEQKRKHPRADVNWSVLMETSEGTVEGEAKNISLGGAFICCGKPLPLGEVFHLTLMGPEKEPVTATAAVVWSNANVPTVINRGMGVRFIKMSDRHFQIVRQFFQENRDIHYGVPLLK
jgi:uncharacterized protein (TIGR02266 family)